MSVVAITWIPIKKDAESSPAAKALGGLKEKFLAKADLEHAYNGKSVDPNEPPSIELFDVWSSLETAKAAEASSDADEAKGVFMELLDTTAEHKPYHNIIVFNKDFAPVAESPIVHLTAVFLPLDVNVAEFDAAWVECVKGWGGAEGWVAGAAGWGQDDVDVPKLGKQKVFLLSAGWTSVDAAQAATEKAKESFKTIEKFSEHTQTRFTKLTKHK